MIGNHEQKYCFNKPHDVSVRRKLVLIIFNENISYYLS